jgi:hypothetical protein
MEPHLLGSRHGLLVSRPSFGIRLCALAAAFRFLLVSH